MALSFFEAPVIQTDRIRPLESHKFRTAPWILLHCGVYFPVAGRSPSPHRRIAWREAIDGHCAPLADQKSSENTNVDGIKFDLCVCVLKLQRQYKDRCNYTVHVFSRMFFDDFFHMSSVLQILGS